MTSNGNYFFVFFSLTSKLRPQAWITKLKEHINHTDNKNNIYKHIIKKEKRFSYTKYTEFWSDQKLNISIASIAKHTTHTTEWKKTNSLLHSIAYDACQINRQTNFIHLLLV